MTNLYKNLLLVWTIAFLLSLTSCGKEERTVNVPVNRVKCVALTDNSCFFPKTESGN